MLVAGEVGDGEGGTVGGDADEAGPAAAVGDVRTPAEGGGGDEEGVGAGDQRPGGGVEGGKVLVGGGGGGCRLGLAELDVLGAVAEGPGDPDREAGRADARDGAVGPVAAAGVELDAEEADLGTRAQGAGDRVARGREGGDLERA